jgi:hypothetical protein
VLTLFHQNLAQNSRLGRLHDLEIILRNQPPFSHRDDVEPPEARPYQHDQEEREQQIEDEPGKRRGRGMFKPENLRSKIQIARRALHRS